MARVNVKAVCKEFNNLWDRITHIPLYEVYWDFTEDDNDIPTDGPYLNTYETYEDDYEEVCMNVLRAGGRMIKEPTDAFIVTVLANNKNEAVELATNAYNEFYGI